MKNPKLSIRKHAIKLEASALPLLTDRPRVLEPTWYIVFFW